MRFTRGLAALTVLCLLLCFLPGCRGMTAADTLRGDGAIRSLRCLTEQPTALAPVELEAVLATLEGNVYDDDEVALTMTLTGPDGRTLPVIGFYYVPYAEQPDAVLDSEPGTPVWRFRFSPPMAGDWRFSVTLAQQGMVTDTLSGSFIRVAAAVDSRGFLSVEPQHRQTFVFEDGTDYVVIGQNVAWSSGGNAYAYYTEVLQEMQRAGCNFLRLWLAQWDLSLQTADHAPDDLSGGMYRAAMLDHILAQAERCGIYVELCVFSHGQFSRATNPAWDGCAYNSRNRGYLTVPNDFFRDERAKEDTADYLRYLVARWGYSTHIMSWQLFNEADLTEHGLRPLYDWHQEMCEYVRSIDWQGHMVVTSVAGRAGVATMECFDYSAVHWYGYKDHAVNIAYAQVTNRETFSQPCLFDEAGCNNAAGRPVDFDLVNIHQQNWVGLMGGGAGVAVNWYGENSRYLPGYYDEFRPLADFAARIPWSDPDRVVYHATALTDSSTQVFPLGYGSRTYAYLWLLDDGYTNLTKTETTFADYTVTVPLADGTYTAQWIDPRSGEIRRTDTVTAADGTAVLAAPEWTRDLAVAVTAA